MKKKIQIRNEEREGRKGGRKRGRKERRKQPGQVRTGSQLVNVPPGVSLHQCRMQL